MMCDLVMILYNTQVKFYFASTIMILTHVSEATWALGRRARDARAASLLSRSQWRSTHKR